MIVNKGDIVITAENLRNLHIFIQDLPTKYGVALINFLAQVQKENQAEEKPVIPEEEHKPEASNGVKELAREPNTN